MARHDPETAADVREGVLQDRPQAIETVRGWVASLVYGAGWSLADPEAAIQEVTLRVLHLARSIRRQYAIDADAKLSPNQASSSVEFDSGGTHYGVMVGYHW